MPKKISLVLVPGLAANHRMWEAQIEALSDIADCWVAPLPAMDDLGAIAEEILFLAPGKFALAGWSMGGYLCFEMLKRQPDRIAKLALMSTTALPETRAITLRRKVSVREMQRRGFIQVAMETFPRFLHPRQQGDAVLLDGLAKQAFEVGFTAYRLHQDAMANRGDYRQIARAISCPTVVIAGQQDEVTPTHEQSLIAQSIPHASLVILEDCAHMVTFEQPNKASDVLRSWLARDSSAIAA